MNPMFKRRQRAASPVAPAGDRDLARIAADCRRRVTQRALLSAGAAAVPVPGLDLMVDLGVLTRMLHEINREFGLTPAQIEALSPRQRLTVYKAVNALEASVVGRLVTGEMVLLLARNALRRVAAKSVVRYVPLAGQAVAAAISFGALKAIGERHIADCLRVASGAIDIDSA